jgi:hypothetical protein
LRRDGTSPSLLDEGPTGNTNDPAGYASFSDDTKTDGRLSMGFRASINAQVSPSAALDWYYRLVPSLFLEKGELKSEVVLERFRSLSSRVRLGILSGMAEVRIQIFDAQPFALEIHDIFRRTTGSPVPIRMLRTMERSGDQRMRNEARRLLSVAHAYVLDRVTQSFPARRLAERLDTSIIEMVGDLNILGMGGSTRRHRSLQSRTDRPVEIGKQVRPHDIDQALAEGAKSSAVLAEAERRLSKTVETVDGWPVFPLARFARYAVARELEKTHAFDSGDSKSLRGVERQRQEVLDVAFGSDEHRMFARRDAVKELSSASSVYVQAADVAAGFARHVYELEGLRGVIGRFKDVTFNGVPVDRTNLRDALGRMAFVLVD